MNQLNMKINGIEVKAKPGMTILEAAKSVGIDIPTLCYDDRLATYGVCRFCSVELTGKRSRIVVSCVYPAEEGLVVETESPRVSKIRKGILELIHACSPGLEEELAKKYGVEPAKYEREPTFCILCGLCVRYCSEIKKASALGFVGRGTERQVVFYPEIARKSCPGCRGCISICPTGVIPADFALTVPRFTKLPTVFPVRLRDEANLRNLLQNIT